MNQPQQQQQPQQAPQSHQQQLPPPHPHPHSLSHSPPLPNIQSLAISPYPVSSIADYRYNGVFGPPAQVVPSSHEWTSSNKRGSRTGLPQTWYDPSARESPNPHFDAFRRDAPSPPALSPPSSTTSGPTSNSTNPHPYASYQYSDPSINAFASMAVTPSPPPQLGFGLSTTGSVPNLSGIGYNPGGMPQYGSQSLAALTSRSANGNGNGNGGGIWRNGFSSAMQAPLDDDIIPTAIVVKNIPFAVSRDTLLGVIESLGAPLPYAFNYHHDNGVFRGLAFANFRAPEEAASVVAALNGYDVQGRKLRVEYKKVLQPGEKDKIEREKALKRMRSVQFDKELMPPPITVPPYNPPPNANGLSNGNGNGMHDTSPPHSASSGNSDSLPISLDLNDPMSLDIYSRVLVFKEDRMRDELAFSRNLTPTERRIVHLVAQKLGLTSQTKIEGDSKLVVVTRDPSRPNLTSSSSATAPISSSYLSPYATSQSEISPSLRIKKSMPDLRGFNGPVVARDPSRSLTPQRSSGNLRDQFNSRDREYVSMGAAQGRRAGMNGLGSGSFNGLFGSPLDAPPVPPIPSAYGNQGSYSHSHMNGMHSGPSPISGNNNLHRTSAPSLNGSNLSTVSSSPPNSNLDGGEGMLAQPQPVRNPRGPAGESRGFGLRTSASQSTIGGMRGGGSGAGVIGRRVEEEEEELDGAAGGAGGGGGGGMEGSRTRESLDI